MSRFIILLLPLFCLSLLASDPPAEEFWPVSHELYKLIENSDDANAFQNLLLSYPTPRCFDRSQRLSLAHVATKLGRVNILKIILEKFPDLIAVKNAKKDTPLDMAQDLSHTRIKYFQQFYDTLELLLEHTPESKVSDSAKIIRQRFLDNALCYAAIKCDLRRTGEFLAMGADPNCSFFDNPFPLIDQVLSDYLQALYDASVFNGYDSWGRVPYQKDIQDISAIMESMMERAKLYGENKITVQHYWDYRLAKAVYEQKPAEVLEALSHKANIAITLERDKSITLFSYVLGKYDKLTAEQEHILQILAINGAPYVLKLCSIPCNAMQISHEIFDAWLVFAVKESNLEDIKSAFEKGADADALKAKNIEGYVCPLKEAVGNYFAAPHKQKPLAKQIVETLVKHGASIIPELNNHPFQSLYWNTLIERACDKRNTLVACQALQAYLDLPEKKGSTDEIFGTLSEKVAQFFNDYDGVRELIEIRSIFAAPLIAILQQENPLVLKGKDDYQRTLLHLACMTPGQRDDVEDHECAHLDPKVVEALMLCEFDISALDLYKKTAWVYASSYPSEYTVGAQTLGRDAQEPAEAKVKAILLTFLRGGYKPDVEDKFDLVDEAIEQYEKETAQREITKKKLSKKILNRIQKINDSKRMKTILELLESKILIVVDNKIVINPDKEAL